MKNSNTGRLGFTLIELLVVVLIIGILAAVALPQYKKAVYKTRYATLKTLTENLAQAEEVYQLANGTYTDKFDNLDIDMPGGKLADSTDSQYLYDWGSCYLYFDADGVCYVWCKNNQIGMKYQVYPLSSAGTSGGTKICIVDNTDTNSIQAKICAAETGKRSGLVYNTYQAWYYK